MTPDFLDAIRSESRRFVAALRDAEPTAPVPSCPGWTADDLLWHLGEVQYFWATVVADRLQDVAGLEGPERPEGHGALVDFCTAQSGRLHDALAQAAPDESVYMWADDKTVGYIRRRQAHEAMIHRLDAELTVGEVTPLPADLASDGVHEALDVMFGGCPPWGTFTPDALHVHVVASDTGLVVPVVLGRFTGTDPDSGTAYDEDDVSVRAADPSAVPAATITGRADDLDAWLWHRRDSSGLSVAGDPSAYERLVAVLSQPIN